MSLYPQPTVYECGPFALKYALLTYGILADEAELGRAAGTCEANGTDEVGLGRAAQLHGCRLQVIRHVRPAGAREELLRLLEAAVPTLLCVDQWDHWLTAVSAEGDEIVLLDSREEPVSVVVTWDRLASMLVFRKRRFFRTREFYDLHPLLPAHPPVVRARFTVAAARRLADPAHRELAHGWHRRLLDLRGLALRVSGGLPLSRFLHDRAGDLLAAAGSADMPAALRQLEYYALVGDTYDFRIAQDQEADAFERIVRLITPAAGIIAAA